MYWQTTRFRIDLTQPRVMGIVNVTPDSFADGGRHTALSSVLAHCEQLLRDGADLLDIGGESTRPGAAPVSVEEELQRVLPVLTQVLKLGCPVSVDTSKPAVMAAVLELGTDIINDVEALQSPGSLDVVAEHGSCGLCLMHKLGTPVEMQQEPRYDDVLVAVSTFLAERMEILRLREVMTERIVLDPGIGFGKTVEHNISLLKRQRELLALARPLLVGWSRKSTLGAITGRGVEERSNASVAAALLAVQAGASIVRVHDVAATADALKVWQAVDG